MSKGYYTYSTEGNVTTVHYHGPPCKSIARFGPEVPFSPIRQTESDQDRPAETDQDGPKSKKKRKKKDQ